jgi:DNA-binding MarR family transcriptional regulator
MHSKDKTINEIRKFNRFYLVNMGFLSSNYWGSEYSIAETRILFEIMTQGICIQSNIVKALHIDKSYLSRIIDRLCKKGLVEKKNAAYDKRAMEIMLTDKGKTESEKLIALTNRRIESQITELSTDECDQLCNALCTVMTILEKEKV